MSGGADLSAGAEVVAREWMYVRRPDGPLGDDAFELRETKLALPGPGEVLVGARFISVDPANRTWMDGPTYLPMLTPGQVMWGFSIGEVLASRDPEFKAGDIVHGFLGWRNYACVPSGMLTRRSSDHSLETLASILGVAGLTAYFGLLDVGRPKPGETVVVSAAAGAVGSTVVQIAALLGCHVVGIAGGPDKCEWLKAEVGVDAALDYRAPDLDTRLAEACPEGVDIYFDNVGGEITDAVLERLNQNGRVVCCGTVSSYEHEGVERPRIDLLDLIMRRIRIEGFVVIDFVDRWAEAEEVLAGWLADGRLRSFVDIVDGFEELPRALVGLFSGSNWGKRLVRVQVTGEVA